MREDKILKFGGLLDDLESAWFNLGCYSQRSPETETWEEAEAIAKQARAAVLDEYARISDWLKHWMDLGKELGSVVDSLAKERDELKAKNENQ